MTSWEVRILIGNRAAATRATSIGSSGTAVRAGAEPGWIRLILETVLADFPISLAQFLAACPVGGRTQTRQPARTLAYEQRVQITLEEAYRGTQRTFQIDNRRVEVKIPAGAKTGTKVRMSGGGPTQPGAQKSDLYLVMEVLPNPKYSVNGTDLTTEVKVDLLTAVLGGAVTVNTLSGDVSLTIPPGTQPGQKFRLSGRGMPNLKSPQTFGDLYAQVKIELPRKLTDKQRQLFEDLRKYW